MKICIFGAGAIGGFIGAKLAAKGEAEVSLVARGPHLLAMQANGLTVKEKDRETNVRVTATDRPAELGPQDYVILALKAHSVPAVLESIKPLFGPDTAVVTAQNGLPWWYFYKHGGAHENRRIESVDPGGRIWSAIGPERAIGCVVYIAAEIESPGVVRHVEYDRLPLGEPSGEKSERVLALAQLLVPAGIRAAVRPDIRNDIWVKLWGNLSFNPISALTGGTLEQIAGDEGTRAVARAMMVEAEAIANALRREVSDRRRQAHRRRRLRRRAQDLDAAGPRARPADGDRRARHCRAGARPPHGRGHPRHRHRSCPRPPARNPRGVLFGLIGRLFLTPAMERISGFRLSAEPGSCRRSRHGRDVSLCACCVRRHQPLDDAALLRASSSSPAFGFSRCSPRRNPISDVSCSNRSATR